MSDLDNILNRNDKAELIEWLESALEEADKVLIIVVTDSEHGFSSTTTTFGTPHLYDALGILEVAKIDLQTHEEENR